MNRSHRAVSLFGIAAAVLGAAQDLSGQSSSVRFHLPATPYDYTTVAAVEKLEVSALRRIDNTPEHNPTTDAGAALGRVLFYDKLLSRNRRVSCATCHLQSRAFADPRPTSRGFHGRRTARNSMSLVNARYHSSGRFFWDEREATLESMVLVPIQDLVEMGLKVEDAVARLRKDAGYRWLFRQAFGDSEITEKRMGRALAQFIRSISSFRSRFDEGLAKAGSVHKPFPNFSELENQGKDLFFGVGRDRQRSCASCHMTQVSAVDATPPAIFQGEQLANNGLDRGVSKDDPGVGGVTKRPEDDGKFRVPTLRNIALTGPYMHDGRFKTLDDVLKFYSQRVRDHRELDPRMVLVSVPGGAWGSGVASGPITGGTPLRDQVLPQRVLGFPMGSRKRRALRAFLHTLTDHELVEDPRFADPFVPPKKRRRND